jgi:hypothetical protein
MERRTWIGVHTAAESPDSEGIEDKREDDHRGHSYHLNEMCGTATRRLQRTRCKRRENKIRTGNGKDEEAGFVNLIRERNRPRDRRQRPNTSDTNHDVALLPARDPRHHRQSTTQRTGRA